MRGCLRRMAFVCLLLAGCPEEEAAGLTSHFFTTLYRRLDVASFPDLARALVLADRRGEGVKLEFDMADAVASRGPLDDTPGTRAPWPVGKAMSARHTRRSNCGRSARMPPPTPVLGSR